jgi:protein involved in polysaccharide export with SLBB domain
VLVWLLTRGLPVLVVLAVLLLLTGCASDPVPAVRGDAQAFVRLAGVNGSEDSGHEGPRAMEGAEYRLGSPDRVSVSCDRLWALNAERLVVRGDGTIELPMLGTLKVGGMTAVEASDELTRRARAMDRDAIANLTVSERASQHVYVFGQVARPGAWEWKPGQTLMDVLSRVRVVEGADTASVEVVRPDDDGVLRRRVTVDADRLIAGGESGLNLALQAGDVVIVPGREGVVPAWLSVEPAGQPAWMLEAPERAQEPMPSVASIEPTPAVPASDPEPVGQDSGAIRPQPVSVPAAEQTNPRPRFDPFAESIVTPQPIKRMPEDVVFWN